MMNNIIVIGGDRRMIFAAKRLAEKYDCSVCGFGKVDTDKEKCPGTDERYDCAVLPIFTSTDGIPCPLGGGTVGIEVLTGLLKPGAAVFAGKVFPELAEFCTKNGFQLYDYLEREEFAVMNAVLTAEAAAEIAIRETQIGIFGSRTLVLGFGRIGKITARYFAALGADVTAAARKRSDLAWINAGGYKAVDITDKEKFAEALSAADIILNTVPAPILAGESAEQVNSETLLIELASVPCTDGTAVFRIVKAGGLPGKTAPVTAGYIIAETIENIMDERRKQNGGA